MIQIAPSILSADFSRLGDQVRLVEDAGAEVLHIDVMDGHFVPNLTFGPALVQSIRAHSHMRFDIHLMVEEPERFIADFAAAGADHITFHLETSRHAHRVIQQIKEQGMTAGIALNPATPLDGIKYILEDLDMVLLMTVNPGFGGQKFISNVIPKIQVLHQHLEQKKFNCLIEVDGGINQETAPVVAKAGAHILVAGGAVFAQPDPKQAVKKLRQAAGSMKSE
ncbi:ribulose-phosphate 3-epimerase [Desulfosporosinus metallidurans]|uniref:Ribulose-phosphate 3-epimerase n=1 Tax=Desulfosporosinus metallidurans TaxID=1888891 RepID=A0A1Q8R193_9FIRM|nr:ribulose-phosphate 3-epimerase [Desulfosporosinus metallidurans]OLN33348.1 Ribulose-phosphate 3-epimerase [Desulfosporosinus metallidurans]